MTILSVLFLVVTAVSLGGWGSLVLRREGLWSARVGAGAVSVFLLVTFAGWLRLIAPPVLWGILGCGVILWFRPGGMPRPKGWAWLAAVSAVLLPLALLAGAYATASLGASIVVARRGGWRHVLRLPLAFRRRIFLIFKEAINNILRHAHPNKVILTIKKEKRQLLMTITDDGAGFDPARKHQGNGLRNMKERAASMNGDLLIVSAPASGTTVNLRAPIP